jgi:hypothetical protein
VSRSTRGELHELRGITHEHLMYSRASVEQLAARILKFTRRANGASRTCGLQASVQQ